MTPQELPPPAPRADGADTAKLERTLALAELDLKRAELDLKVKQHELERAKVDQAGSWLAQPLTVAILGGVIASLAHVVNTAWAAHETAQLEARKVRTSLVLEAVKAPDRRTALSNLLFYIDMGLLEDPGDKLREQIRLKPETIPLHGTPSATTLE